MGELLESLEVDNQQPSTPLTKCEGSETNSWNSFLGEYNTDMSAGHPVKDDDIVRYSEETQRVQDKELEY